MNLQIRTVNYEPSAPSYAPSTPVCNEPWIIQPKEKIMCTIGTQYEKQPMPKKEKSRQWKLTRLYRRALTKHWIETEKNELEGVSTTNKDEVFTLLECHVELDLDGFQDMNEQTGEATEQAEKATTMDIY